MVLPYFKPNMLTMLTGDGAVATNIVAGILAT